MNLYSNFVYLNKSIILKIHKNEILKTNGIEGLRNDAGLETAVGQPMLTYGGDDLYPTVFLKAAALCYSIAEGQVFVDGNKRTALISALTFLQLNGFTVLKSDELYGLIIGLADKGVTREDLADAFERLSESNV